MACERPECVSLTKEKDNLSDQLKMATKEKEDFNEGVKKAQEELNKAKEGLTKANEDLKKTNGDLTNVKEALTKKEKELEETRKLQENQAAEKKNIVEQNEKLKKELESLNNQKITLEASLRQANETNSELQKKLDDLTKALEEARKLNEIHTAEKKTSMEENERLNKEFDLLNARNEDIKISFEILQQENEEFVREKAELKLQIERLLAEKPSQPLSHQNDKLSRQENANNRSEQSRENYDCVIPMNSLSSLLANQFWPLELKADYVEKYEERIMMKSMKVAVIGFERVGKTFLVNKLKDLPHLNSKHTKTRGISLIYPQENEVPCTIIDTSGTNISIKEGALEKTIKEYFDKKSLSKEERKRMLYEDVLLMESLIEEFLFQHTQVLLVVVGRIRREDQGFLERIKTRKGKRVIIVHNFIEAQYEDDIGEMIKEDVEDICNATKQRFFMNCIGKNQNDFIYRENDLQRTEHVILAQEGSEAGDFYNTSAINYLKQVISTSDYSDEIDLPDAFAKYLNAHITKYLLPADEVQGDFISLEKEENIPIAFKLNQPDKYGIKVRRSKEIYQTDDGSKEEFDNIRYRAKTLAHSNDPEKKILQLEFEVVGNFNEKDIGVKISEGNDHVVLGVKGATLDNKKDGDEIHEDTRRFGQFKVITKPINIKGYTISRANRPKISSEVPGLMVMTCNLEPIAFDDF